MTNDHARSTGPPRVEVFFVGVGKAGTTWLYEFVDRHRLGGVPSVKETHVVDVPIDEQASLVRRLWSTERQRCDFSNTSYWDPDNPRKVVEHNPDARVVVTVRRPGERARSHFHFLRRNGMTSATTLAEEVAAGDPHDVVERCDYDRILTRYRRVLPADRILVLPLEQLREDPERYVTRLCNFLDRPVVVLDDDDRRPVLARARPRSVWLSRLAKATATRLRESGRLELLGRLKRSAGLRRLLFRETATPDEPIELARLDELDRAYDRLLADEAVVSSHLAPR